MHTIEEIQSHLNKFGYETEKVSSLRLVVKTDKNRSETITQVSKLIGGVYDPTPLSASSLGCIHKGNFKVIVKPKDPSRGGVQNEQYLHDRIDGMIKLANVVEFYDGKGETFRINVEKLKTVYLVGSDTRGRKKADIVIGGVPISIKKDNAECWESADSYMSDFASQAVDFLVKKGLIKVEFDLFGCAKISRSFAFKSNLHQCQDVVFGSDLIPNNGAVIRKTFTHGDFTFHPAIDELSILVSKIITKPSQVNMNDVWFLVRPDRTRKSIKGYPGLRVLAITESRISKNVLRLGQDLQPYPS